MMNGVTIPHQQDRRAIDLDLADGLSLKLADGSDIMVTLRHGPGLAQAL
ncbi:MAG: hypothetical protein ACJ8AW_05495 [Rhodopila sp.]